MDKRGLVTKAESSSLRSGSQNRQGSRFQDLRGEV